MVGRLSAFEFGWAKFFQIQWGHAAEKTAKEIVVMRLIQGKGICDLFERWDGVMFWGRVFKFQNWPITRLFDGNDAHRPILKFERPPPFLNAMKKGATVLPSSVRQCSSSSLSNNEDTALSKTPKPWHPDFRPLFHLQRATVLPPNGLVVSLGKLPCPLRVGRC